jgi:Group II intron, maturase-specific domain
MPTAEVIKQLSPVIRGWCNYCRHAVAKRRSANLDPPGLAGHLQMGQTPPSQAEPTLGSPPLLRRRPGPRLGPVAGHNRLPRHNETRVSRFVKVKDKASPFAPSLRDYWGNRRHRRVREAGPFHRVHLQRQAGRCAAGQAVLDPDLEPGRQHQRLGAPRPRRPVVTVRRFETGRAPNCSPLIRSGRSRSRPCCGGEVRDGQERPCRAWQADRRDHRACWCRARERPGPRPT